jgi:hypothetical protein
MRRTAGILLLLAGLLPLGALAVAAYWLWVQHMYTIGLSANLQGEGTLAGLLLADLACLVLGTWLVRGRTKGAV